MTSTKDRYDCSHKHRGYALIFANEDVEPKRKGALDDEMNMKNLFRHLKFDVSHCRSDVLDEEIVGTLEEVLAKDEFLKNSDCFVFVISTHGKEILSSDGKTYQQQLSCTGKTSITTQEIVRMVSECKALEGKPKLFFIQACRVRGKIDRNTQDGRDPGHIFHVKKEDSYDETNESPKHSPAQLSVGHTMDVRSEEERQKLANLVVNCDDDQGDTVAIQNSASAITVEDSQLPAAVNMEIGHSMPDSSFPKDTAYASQNSASTITDEDSKLSTAMEMGHSIPNSSLPVDAGQNLASTATDLASTDPAAEMVEIRPISCPKDTLIMYSIPPGYIARRQSDGGSVMLDKLKNILENIPEDKSLLAALTEVIGRVARDYEYIPDMEDYKVKDLTEEERRRKTLYKIVPVINHRLRYDFYFTKKDD